MAIALDATTEGALVNPGTSSTWSHTCTGSDRILFVNLFGDVQSVDNSGNAFTNVTYNGVALTEIGRQYVTGDRWTYLCYLINPSTGANNVVITFSQSVAIKGAAVSYTGAKQTSQPDAFTTNKSDAVAANTDYTTTVTTVADNCWLVMSAKNLPGTIAASTGSTIRQSTNGNVLIDSNGALSPAGSKSMSIQTTLTSNFATVMASFSPSETSTINNLTVLGAGA